MSVEATNSHRDYFVKNLSMLRAEERLGLGVYRPIAFTEVRGPPDREGFGTVTRSKARCAWVTPHFAPCANGGPFCVRAAVSEDRQSKACTRQTGSGAADVIAPPRPLELVSGGTRSN